MAIADTTRLGSRRKSLSLVARDGLLRAVPRPDAVEVPRSSLCPTPHLTVAQLVQLYACIEGKGGIATIDDISRALPTVEQPVSAVLDLCDAGLLCVDLAAAFDGTMAIWRAER